MLEGFVVALQFAPVTKAMRISNIPQGTSSDAIKFRFSNPKTGGSEVVNMRFDGNTGVAIIYFEEPSGIYHTLFFSFREVSRICLFSNVSKMLVK